MIRGDLFFVYFLPILFSLTGCLPRALEPCSENVLIMPNNPYVCKDCKFVGKIVGNNIHGEFSPFTSEEDLLTDDINYLKIEGRKLNANVVVYKQHATIQTPHWSPIPKQHFYNEITHNVQGEAYVCSWDEVQSIRHKSINKNRNY